MTTVGASDTVRVVAARVEYGVTPSVESGVNPSVELGETPSVESGVTPSVVPTLVDRTAPPPPGAGVAVLKVSPLVGLYVAAEVSPGSVAA